MADERIINEIIELNKQLSSIKSFEDISGKLKNILLEYKDSISSLDSSMHSYLDNFTEGNNKLDRINNEINILISENKPDNFSKLYGILNEVKKLIGEQSKTIKNISNSFNSNKNESLAAVQEIKLGLDEIEKKFYSMIDDIKCSTLKLSNFLKFSILDELSNLREDVNKLNAEKEKLLQEIKSISNNINNDYIEEIQYINKNFADVCDQIQTENNTMRNNMDVIIQQNAVLINVVEILKDKNEVYKEFIDEMLNDWREENIRWFARKGR